MNGDGYTTTGQGVLGNNMFGYCGNNPVNNVDPSGNFWDKAYNFIKKTWTSIFTSKKEYNKSISVSGYIYNQSEGNAAMYKYGAYNSDYNGCGWVATYNALIMLKDRTHPADIIDEYEQNGLVLGGTFGTKKSSVVDYFESKGYTVTVTTDTSKFDSVAKDNRANILYYWHDSGSHYVAIKWTGTLFYGLNTFSDSSAATRWDPSISAFMDNRGYRGATLISIS